jgi:hypothetical protein
MLKKFSNLGNSCANMCQSRQTGRPGKFSEFCDSLCRPGAWRLWRLKRWAWPCFALATFLLFLYLLRQPGWYLMLVLFLQVVGLLLSLYRPGC